MTIGNRIQRWHAGKVILIGAWGIIAELLAVVLLKAYQDELRANHVFLGMVLLGIMGTIPIAISAVAWIWFGGKEGPDNATKSAQRG
jgi:Co/Zn/Cd efflux system component